MRSKRGWAGLRTAAIALSLAAVFGSAAGADTIMSFSTSGAVDSTGVTGPGVISFDSVASGAFNAPSSFSLGSFQVAGLPPGQSTTYTNTPFHITYVTNMINGDAPGSVNNPLVVSGVLNGTITGSSQSDVVATFSPISTPTFAVGNYENTLSISETALSLVPSTTNGGLTTAQASLTTLEITHGIPEPSTMALFAFATAGLAVRHRLRKSKNS